MKGYLLTGIKNQCTGCEACANCCPVSAIRMVADEEGFRYPVTDAYVCINCGLCHRVCPEEHEPEFNFEQSAFGGSVCDEVALEQSTSGGAFSALMQVWAAEGEYAVFGAEAPGLEVFHSSAESLDDVAKFRKSKYLQSHIGSSYLDTKKMLQAGKRVLFSGTPCQIAGLNNFLGRLAQTDALLTVEVVCEGVPSPLYVQKMADEFASNGCSLRHVDYRYKDGAKWDFQVMKVTYTDANGRECSEKKDRWFNRFWNIWLAHLMSRPSCYRCPYARRERVADITLGDLWGVHIYCPDLYNRDRGASVMVANTAKGRAWATKATALMQGRELPMEQVIRYQGPMRKSISMNPEREAFMADLQSPMTLRQIQRKWSRRPSLKLLWQKYVWGNRQKVALWNLKRKFL